MNSILNKLRSNLLKQSGYIITGSVIAQIITFLTMTIVTRIYDPAHLGDFGVFNGVILVLAPCVCLSIAQAIQLPKHNDEVRQIVSTAFWLILTFALITLTIIFFFRTSISTRFSDSSEKALAFLIPLTLLSVGLIQISTQLTTRQHLFKGFAIGHMVHSLSMNGCRLVAGIIFPGALSLALSSITANAVRWIYLNRELHLNSALSFSDSLVIKPGFSKIKKTLIEYKSFPLFVTPRIFLDQASSNAPIFLLALLSSPTYAGFFMVCMQALKLPTRLVGTAVTQVIYPYTATARNNSKLIFPILLKCTLGLSLLGLCPLLIIFIYGPKIFIVLFGEEWALSGIYAKWLSLWMFAFFSSRVCFAAIPVLKIEAQALTLEIMSTVTRLLLLYAGLSIFRDSSVGIKWYSISFSASLVLTTLWILYKAYTEDEAYRST